MMNWHARQKTRIKKLSTIMKVKTMDEYANWEKDCQKIKQQNQVMLDDFAEWLKQSGVKKTTIDKH